MLSPSPSPDGFSTSVEFWKKKWLESTKRMLQITDPFVGGWFFEQEAEILLQLSACLPLGSTVVEVGSFMGKSTRYLTAGTRYSGSFFYCIDPFESSGEGEPEKMQEYYQEIAPGGTLSLLSYNLRFVFQKEDLDHLTVQRDYSLRAAKAWPKTRPGTKIDLIFIDGNHKEAFQDFLAWKELVAPWGLIAMHDSHCGGIYGANGPDNTIFYACQQYGYHVFAGANTLTVLAHGKPEPGNETIEFWRTRLESFTGDKRLSPAAPGTVPAPAPDGQPGDRGADDAKRGIQAGVGGDPGK